MPAKIISFFILVLFSFFGWAWWQQEQQKTQIPDFHQSEYLGSESCKACHQDRYDSWHNTYHRTMTQEADSNSVLGEFNGKPQTYWGYTIRPIKKGNKFYFAYYDESNTTFLNEIEIKRTVGSRRYQQYLAQTEFTEGNYFRLELLWHIEDQRWIHLNGAFLDSDQQSFSQHTGIWNQNCIFCHNTGIEPGMTNYQELVQQGQSGKAVDVTVDARFESSVAELGIGCESCHSPGSIHTELIQNPIRKYFYHLTDNNDPSIVVAEKLNQQKSLSVCAQCHGQRMPKKASMAKTWMEDGPTYRPNDDIEDHVNPVWRDTVVHHHDENIYKNRFWQDGTPRLTAYEYQGIKQSACIKDTEFTCMSCHNMHGGDPKGMIDVALRSNEACASCHQDLVQNPEPHTGHTENSTGSLCYDCHMPKMTYGIMTFHRNHKIESPLINQELAIEKPNACVACHLNQTDAWFIESSQKLWQQEASHQPTGHIQSLVELHSGDPVQRALAAYQMGQHFESLPAQNRMFLIPHLLLALSDRYPAVRRFAHKSLLAIITPIEREDLMALAKMLQDFDFIASPEQRETIEEQINFWLKNNDFSDWPTPPAGSMLNDNHRLIWDELKPLMELALSENKSIHVGE